MLPDLASSTLPLRSGAITAVVLAIVVMVSVPSPGNADTAPSAPHAWAGPNAGGAPVTTSTKATTSTNAHEQRRTVRDAGTTLPLVLAAIIFLALLVPASGFHSHRHWHSH
jgi:hypothetical protein